MLCAGEDTAGSDSVEESLSAASAATRKEIRALSVLLEKSANSKEESRMAPANAAFVQSAVDMRKNPSVRHAKKCFSNLTTLEKLRNKISFSILQEFLELFEKKLERNGVFFPHFTK